MGAFLLVVAVRGGHLGQSGGYGAPTGSSYVPPVAVVPYATPSGHGGGGGGYSGGSTYTGAGYSPSGHGGYYDQVTYSQLWQLTSELLLSHLWRSAFIALPSIQWEQFNAGKTVGSKAELKNSWMFPPLPHTYPRRGTLSHDSLFNIYACQGRKVRGNRDSAVDIATGYRLDGECSIPERDNSLFSILQCQDRLWVPTTLLFRGFQGYLHGVEAAGAWT
jgi:hypothetical protein